MLMTPQPIEENLDHDHRAAVADVDALRAPGVEQDRAQVGAVGVGGRHVRRHRAVVERVPAAARAVDELVADHERPRRQGRIEAARRARADDPVHAELAHRPQVGPVGHRVRRQLVVAAVAGQEGHPLPADVADREAIRRRAVGRVHGHLLGILQERVEPRPAEDADLGRRAHTSPPGVQIRGRSGATGPPAAGGSAGPAGGSGGGAADSCEAPCAGRSAASA
jgi:hypothetical protein